MIKQELKDKMKEKGMNDEQIDFVENEIYKEIMHCNGYKVKCETPTVIFKQEYNGKAYYKIPVVKTGIDGKPLMGYKTVRFINCEPPDAEKCKIIIHNLFEDYWYKSNDKYNAIFTIVITDYEYCQNEARTKYEAIKEYNNTKKDDSEDYFILDQPINEIDEDELPF